jgi:hypothetical protein
MFAHVSRRFCRFPIVDFQGFEKSLPHLREIRSITTPQKTATAIFVGNNQRSAHNNNCVLEADVQEGRREEFRINRFAPRC